MKSYSSHIPALTGIGVTAAVLFIAGPGNVVIPSIILIVFSFMLARKQIEARMADSDELLKESAETKNEVRTEAEEKEKEGRKQ